MSGPSRLYRLVLLAYPPSFRRRFGDEMAACFDDLVVDHGTLRAAARMLLDLIPSVLVQHVEVLMEHTDRRIATSTIAVGAAVSALAAISFGGPGAVVLFPVALGLLAFAAYRSSLVPFRDDEAAVGRRWWQFVVAGGACLGALAGGSAVLHLPWMPWGVQVLTFLVGWLLIAFGLLLGAARALGIARRGRTA